MKPEASGVYPMLIPFYTADDRVDHAALAPSGRGGGSPRLPRDRRHGPRHGGQQAGELGAP